MNSIKQLKSALNNSPEMKNKFISDPVAFLNDLNPPIYNPKIYLMVVAIVGITLFASIVLGGIIALDTTPGPDGEVRQIPDFIVMLGSTALGALAGLLVPSPQNSSE